MEDHAHLCGSSDSCIVEPFNGFQSQSSFPDSSGALTANALQPLSVCRHPAWESAARTVNVRGQKSFNYSLP